MHVWSIEWTVASLWSGSPIFRTASCCGWHGCPIMESTSRTPLLCCQGHLTPACHCRTHRAYLPGRDGEVSPAASTCLALLLQSLMGKPSSHTTSELPPQRDGPIAGVPLLTHSHTGQVLMLDRCSWVILARVLLNAFGAGAWAARVVSQRRVSHQPAVLHGAVHPNYFA